MEKLNGVWFLPSKWNKKSSYVFKKRWCRWNEQRNLPQQFSDNLDDTAFLGSSFLDENDQKIYLEDYSGDYFD